MLRGALLILFCVGFVPLELLEAQSVNVVQPFCTNFEDNSTHNWVGNYSNTSIQLETVNHYLYCTDDQGPSSIVVTAGTEYLGDWTQIMSTCCGALWYDIRIIDDAWQQGDNFAIPNMVPYIIFYGSHGSERAGWYPNFSVVEGGPWTTVKAPVTNCNGDVFPSSAFGQWRVWDSNGNEIVSGSAGAGAAWQSIFSNVVKILLPIEWGAPRPEEKVAYDNLCIKNDDCICGEMEFLPPPGGYPDTSYVINTGCCWSAKIKNQNPAGIPVTKVKLVLSPASAHFATNAAVEGTAQSTYHWTVLGGGGANTLTFGGDPVPINQMLELLDFCIDRTSVFGPFTITWSTLDAAGNTVCTGTYTAECDPPCDQIDIVPVSTDPANCCSTLAIDNQWHALLIRKVRMYTFLPVRIAGITAASPWSGFPTAGFPLNSVLGTYTPGLPLGLSQPFDICFTGQNNTPFYLYFEFMDNNQRIWCRDSILITCGKGDDCCRNDSQKGCTTYASASMNCSGAGGADLYLNAYSAPKRVTRFAVTLLSAYGTTGSNPTPLPVSARIDQASGCNGPLVPSGADPFNLPESVENLWMPSGSSPLYEYPCISSGAALHDVYARSHPGTSQVVWGNYPPQVYPTWPSVTMNPGVDFMLHLAFTAPPSVRRLHYCLQYQYTYENCCTCDTVKWDSVSVVLIRSVIFGTRRNPCNEVLTPLGAPIGLLEEGGGQESTPAGSGVVETAAASDDGVYIEMADLNFGTLYFNFPALSDSLDKYKVVELSVKPEADVQIVAMYNLSDGTFARVAGGEAFAGLQLAETGSAVFSLAYFNPKNKRLIQNAVSVRIVSLDNPKDTIKETGLVFARVPLPPGAARDSIGTDELTHPVQVHTYAVYFENANSSREKVHQIVLKPKNNAAIIAVGPASDTTQVTLRSYYDAPSGLYYAYTDPCKGCEAEGIEAGRKLHPIYLTVSGAASESVILDYSTVNDRGDTISAGEVTLRGPLTTGVRAGDGEVEYRAAPGDAFLASCYPNPASNSATIQFTLARPMDGVTLTIADAAGREIARLVDGQALGLGEHAFVYNTLPLPAGTYYYTLTAGQVRQTRAMKIVR